MTTNHVPRVILAVLLAIPVQLLAAPLATPEPADDITMMRDADTSSPRATLRGFLADTNEALAEYRGGSLTLVGQLAFTRAARSLDFSNTPDSDSWATKVIKVLLLRELLDRMVLPADEQIPGAAEVADAGIVSWTIPNSRIRISRVTSGPLAGAFLFSAGTVERLDRLYAQMRHLPYQPGKSGAFFEAWIKQDGTILAESARIRRRLKAIDTSSPRTTLQEFLRLVNTAYEIVMNADEALDADPPTMTKMEAVVADREAEALLRRARYSLDLSAVPLGVREDVGLEAALQIKEIIDRTPLPPIESVPDERMVANLRAMSGGGPIRWRLPNTSIEIVEVQEGEWAGQFLFSPRTVDRAGVWYERVSDLDYRTFLADLPGDYVSPGVSKGFYRYYISTPGLLVHGASRLGQLVDSLPPALKELSGGQTRWQWIGFVLTALAVVLAVIFLFFLTYRLANRLTDPWDAWLRILAPIISVALFLLAIDFIDADLNFTGDGLVTVKAVGGTVNYLLLGLTIFLVFQAGAETLIAKTNLVERPMNASVLRIVSSVLGVVIAAMVVVVGVRRLGADLIPLVAGLGVGGLAVALAAQKTFANFIGSIILFANKPIREGDFCRFGDEIGTVEKIGLHSTRVRTLDRTIITIPNANFSEMQLDNFAMRDQRLLKFVLGLRYETTPEQMRYILVKLRELLLGHPMVTPDPARVRFVGFGAYSKDVEIFAYIRCQDQSTFLAIKEDILLRMEDIILEAGSGFAFPSQTAYLARDGGVDAGQTEQAEMRIQQLRATGKLPFPEFEDEEREALEDILDYPPRGSPDYQGRT